MLQYYIMLRRILLNEILPGQIVERDEDGKFYILSNDEIELRQMFDCKHVQEESKESIESKEKQKQKQRMEKKFAKVRIR